MPAARQFGCRAVLAVLLAILLAFPGWAQPAQSAQQDDIETTWQRARQFFDANNLVEARPLLEKVVAARPDDAHVHIMLAFAIVATAISIPDVEARKAERRRARQLALRARELGSTNGLIDVVLEIPEDGSSPAFSERKEVDEAMKAGEGAFVRADFPAALKHYAHALSLDPNNYEAALFSGDVYYKQKQYDKAGEWFARAIAINPNRETAYRYWGDAFMNDGKTIEARDKFIDAIIAEPYNQSPWRALIVWGQRNNVQLSHPRIESPNTVTSDAAGNKTNIVIDANTLGKKDGTSAWLIYSLNKATWRGEKFAKEFPGEKEYRPSLREEVEALNLVATSVKEQTKKGEVTHLNPSLGYLLKLQEEGLIEAFVLFAKANAGIARDYEGYRKENREKLRKYLTEYVAPVKD